MAAEILEKDINDYLAINIRRLGHVLRCISESPGSQKRVLSVLAQEGPLTQRRLTEMLRIQPGSVSEVLAKLEKAGLLVRTENEQDHRTTDIRLTEAGVEEAKKAVAQRSKRQGEMFSCLTDEEKQQFLALMEKINADWDDRYMNGRWMEKEEA